LKCQQWNNGAGWNYQFSPSWVDYDTGVHIYDDIMSARRAGNAFLINQSSCKIIEIQNKMVVWYWDFDESNAAEMPVDNLVIYDGEYNEVWDIHTFLGREEMCTGVGEVDNITIGFNTWCGIRFEIDIVTFEEKKRTLTK
jgi:hypothetical protein